AASPLGTALAPLLLSVLVASFHWRWAFIVTGALGLVVAVVWFAFYRDPVRAQLSAAERNYLDADAQSVAAAPKLTFAEWRSLFSHGTTWGMLIGFFGSV
ncbi:MFS transporter, partial [Burkholderia sola]